MNTDLKVLVIEDSGTKYRDIETTLEHLGVTDISHEISRNAGLRNLLRSYNENHPYDLLILDMQFPIFNDSQPIPDAGISVLTEIERKGWEIPVIVCSSIETDCKACFENVIADIQYDPMLLMTHRFELALSELQNKNEKLY